ncbi:hypothetical protein LLG96_13975 [bacterium]|nr:hypothetical protein [bacterium]
MGIITFLAVCSPAPTELEYNNPEDEKSSKYTPPKIITITNLDDGDVITSRNLKISWLWNEITTKCQYRIDNNTWNDCDTTFVYIEDIEEGAHTFTIMPENEFHVGEKDTTNFVIETIKGPGITFSPRKVTGLKDVSVYLYDVTNLMGAHIEIIATQSCADIDTLIVSNSPDSSLVILSKLADSNRLVIDFACLITKKGISGNLLLGSFTVNQNNTGEITVDREKTKFRDINNSAININSEGLDFVRVYK